MQCRDAGVGPAGLDRGLAHVVPAGRLVGVEQAFEIAVDQRRQRLARADALRSVSAWPVIGTNNVGSRDSTTSLPSCFISEYSVC